MHRPAAIAKRPVARPVVWLAVAAWVALAAGAPGAHAQPPDPAQQMILGNWLTQMRDGIIQFSVSTDGILRGRIVGGDGPNRLDDKNPDPALRSRRLFGSIIVRDMKYDGHGRWSGGSIYDPDTGHTYRCHLQLLDSERLRVRGYLGVAMLGRTQIWTRYLGTSMQLAPSGH